MIMQKIYIIKRKSDNCLKIGISQFPEKRLKQLQCGSGCELSLVYESHLMSNARMLECLIHKELDGHTSGEWFLCSEDSAKIIIIKHLENSKISIESKKDGGYNCLHLWSVVNFDDENYCGAGLRLSEEMNDINFKDSAELIFRMLISVATGSDFNFIKYQGVLDRVMQRMALVLGHTNLGKLQLGFELV